MTSHPDDFDAPSPPRPPRLLSARYLIGTWSGRLILVNALVFLYVSLRSGSVLMPDMQTLVDAGAKVPWLLAAGEWWRLVTPMFIHIGLLHFAVNTYVLFAVGNQLERVLGGAWFLAIYLAAGVAGNVASAVFSLNLSAGASGAIFGLLGAGFYLERSVGRRIRQVTGQRPRQRAYAATVALNLALGFLIPFIDNSAHLGGLVAGVVLTAAMVNLRPNALQTPRRPVGYALIVALVAVALVGARFGMSPRFLLSRYRAAAAATTDPQEQYDLLTMALRIAPEDADLRLSRARLLFFDGSAKDALLDLRIALETPAAAPAASALASDLEAHGHAEDAWQVRRMIEHGTAD